MIGSHRHIHEAGLIDHYVAERTGGFAEPPIGAHLADCAECQARFKELQHFMDQVWADGDAEVEALFPPERLAAQRQEIARRLEHIGHAARVISFPAHAGAARSIGLKARGASRWVTAAAAAAGLFVGVAVGTLYNPTVRRPIERTAVEAVAPAAVPASATTAPALAALDEDEFLNELEFALEGPSADQLLLFDALTPSVREVRAELISY